MFVVVLGCVRRRRALSNRKATDLLGPRYLCGLERQRGWSVDRALFVKHHCVFVVVFFGSTSARHRASDLCGTPLLRLRAAGICSVCCTLARLPLPLSLPLAACEPKSSNSYSKFCLLSCKCGQRTTVPLTARNQSLRAFTRLRRRALVSVLRKTYATAASHNKQAAACCKTSSATLYRRHRRRVACRLSRRLAQRCEGEKRVQIDLLFLFSRYSSRLQLIRRESRRYATLRCRACRAMRV